MQRTFAISDIHGCLKELETMINRINLAKEDKLIILGDNIDRGPNSVGVVFKIKELRDQGCQIIALMGNHEEMFIHDGIKFDTINYTSLK